jgi:hypothetical protein
MEVGRVGGWVGVEWVVCRCANRENCFDLLSCTYLHTRTHRLDPSIHSSIHPHTPPPLKPNTKHKNTHTQPPFKHTHSHTLSLSHAQPPVPGSGSHHRRLLRWGGGGLRADAVDHPALRVAAGTWLAECMCVCIMCIYITCVYVYIYLCVCIYISHAELAQPLSLFVAPQKPNQNIHGPHNTNQHTHTHIYIYIHTYAPQKHRCSTSSAPCP